MCKLILDTETAGTFNSPICYDVSGVIIDDDGEELEHFAIIINDVFFTSIMDTAAFKDKKPLYMEDISNRVYSVMTYRQAKVYINSLLFAYNITQILAYNARFDKTALEKTAEHFEGVASFFESSAIEWIDILKMARHTLKVDEYNDWCLEFGFLTKHEKPRSQFTAEVVYRFITKNPEFQELHMGIYDSQIEKEIYLYCMNEIIHSFAL